MPRRTPRLITACAAIVLAAGACAADGEELTATANPLAPAIGPAGAVEEAGEVVVHRDPECPCCSGWQDVMRSAGFDVVEEHHGDTSAVKDELGVPGDQRSCHTATVAGYVVEGHVPVEAVVDLLEQRPAVDGIALAGMPMGSPGMPGQRSGPFVVTLIDSGEVVGELGRY